MEMAPASGTSRPAMDLSNVVLPQPEGPKKERIPFSNSKLTLSRALTSLNVLISPWTFKIAILEAQPLLLSAQRCAHRQSDRPLRPFHLPAKNMPRPTHK